MKMTKQLPLFHVIITLLLLFSLPAYSESRAKLSGDFENLSGLFEEVTPFSDASALERSVSPIQFSGRIIGEGRFKVTLQKERRSSGVGKKRFRLFQGEARILKGKKVTRFPLAATVVERDGGVGYRFFVPASENVKRVRAYELRGVVTSAGEKENLKVRRTLRRRTDPRYCGSDHSSSEQFNGDVNPLTDDSAETSATYRVAEVLVEGDTEYFSKVSDGNQELNSIVNIVDAFYKRDLGVTISASVTSTAVPYGWVIDFDENFELDTHQEIRQKHPNTTYDLVYAFTGKQSTNPDLKNLAGMVPGLGNVCVKPTDAIGMVIRFDTNEDSVTFAHEMGHNFNAEHDDAHTNGDAYIMHSGTVSANNYVNEFSSNSKQVIGAFISANGSCLGTGEGSDPGNGGGGGETPGGGDGGGSTGTVFEVDGYVEREGRTKYYVVEAYDEDGNALDGVEINFLFKKRKRRDPSILETQTTAEGYAYVEMTNRGFYGAQTSDGEFETRFKRNRKRKRR